MEDPNRPPNRPPTRPDRAKSVGSASSTTTRSILDDITAGVLNGTLRLRMHAEGEDGTRTGHENEPMTAEEHRDESLTRVQPAVGAGPSRRLQAIETTQLLEVIDREADNSSPPPSPTLAAGRMRMGTPHRRFARRPSPLADRTPAGGVPMRRAHTLPNPGPASSPSTSGPSSDNSSPQGP